MKILISFFPTLFPDQNHGGSSKIIKQVSKYLGESGDKITIVCNRRSDNNRDFYLYPNVLVRPIYRFKETVPDPYFTPPFFIKSAIDILQSLSQENDVIFIFDSNFIFTDMLPPNKPIFFSLRDFLYSQALQGAFLMRRGGVIVNSEFVKDSMLATVGSFYPNLKNNIQVIHNGIDTSLFIRRKPDGIKTFIDLSEKNYPILLFPHRPESDKGIDLALDLVRILVYKHNFKSLKLLIAKGMDENISTQVTGHYGSVYEKAKSRGVEKNIYFHSWIPEALMPEYYSLGDITLSIGDIVEAFSNVTIESLSCSTPVIASNVACYRYLFPDWLISKVDPGDINSLAHAALNILSNKKEKNSKKIKLFLEKNFSNYHMCKRYREVLHDSKLGYAELKFDSKVRSSSEGSFIKLSPWCYITRKGNVYNDYLKIYIENENLDLANLSQKKKFSNQELRSSGFSDKDIKKYMSLGVFTIV